MYRVRIKTKEGYKEYIVESLKEIEEEFNKPNEGVYIDNISQYREGEKEKILTLKK